MIGGGFYKATTITWEGALKEALFHPSTQLIDAFIAFYAGLWRLGEIVNSI